MWPWAKKSRSEIDSEIPFVTFEGWLKNHVPKDRDEVGALLFGHTFGVFSDSGEKPTLDPINAMALKAAQERGFQTFDTSSARPRRRLAGDWAGLRLLSRGRYYTVCLDQGGNDGETLPNELNSYVNVIDDGFAFAQYPAADRMNIVRVNLADIENLPSRPLTIAREAGLVGSSVHRHSYEIGTTVVWRQIDRVLDLRRPEARQFLFQKFANGDNDWIEYRGRPVPEELGFYRLLPTLMDRKAGGNGATDQIAGYLRNNGVSALIFPSARSNVHVHWNNRELVDFKGWNLVDWSGEEPPPKKKLVWLTDWNPPLDGGITVAAAPDNSPHRGSFRIENNVEHHRFLLHAGLLLGVAKRKPEDTGWITGYCWHAGRLLSKGPHYLTRCLSCGDETDRGSSLGAPQQCPKCGHRNIWMP
jgi:hypothetical protein